MNRTMTSVEKSLRTNDGFFVEKETKSTQFKKIPFDWLNFGNWKTIRLAFVLIIYFKDNIQCSLLAQWRYNLRYSFEQMARNAESVETLHRLNIDFYFIRRNFAFYQEFHVIFYVMLLFCVQFLWTQRNYFM